jgi:NADH:ubiquinone oxidoreductase subunit 2 (subunit N)
LILAITSVAGLFYYLRIVVALYAAPPQRAFIRAVPRSGVFVVIALAAVLIWAGVYPTPLLKLVPTGAAPRDRPGASLVTKLNR